MHGYIISNSYSTKGFACCLLWGINALIDSFIGTLDEKAVKAPIWYSLFPMTPYTPKPPVKDPNTGKIIQPKEDFDFNRLLFGYPDIEPIREWIKCKCEEWNAQQLCALNTNCFNALKKEAEESGKN